MSSLLDNIYAECFSPVKVEMIDSITHEKIVREVPCGKCYHCRITKVNEWVTRMICQSLFSKYVYFGTLTYACTNTTTFAETLPQMSSINKDRKYMPTPVLLQKSHLQKFFKRLRKNTGIKFQYFACGEYGGTYGRPHFHYIMWSDIEITENQVSYSWSELVNSERVSLGRVEHQDMRKDAINIEHSYKYVCKYLQKSNFDFNKLPTKELHEKAIKNDIIGVPCSKEYYQEELKKYLKNHSPFTLCSRRPAIGFEYFEKNIGEFQKGNFKLFGLQGCNVFPVYYYRKTRESICPYKTISCTNGKPNSYSNIPSVVSLLVELQNAISFNEGFLSNSSIVECRSYTNTITFPRRGQGFRGTITLPARYFNFYDCKNKLYYYLRGDGNYDVCAKRYHKLYTITANELINELVNTYNNLLDAFVLLHHEQAKYKQQEKKQKILSEFGTHEKYLEERKKVINNLLSVIELKQHKYELTKTTF